MAKPAKRGVGRPSLGAAARRRVVTIKLTDVEYDRVAAAAGAENMSLTEWLRAAAELALARGSATS